MLKPIYNVAMNDRPEKTRLQINVRLTPAQVSQLVDLTMLYGSQSRAVTAAIEMLWRGTAEERRRFIDQPRADDDADATPPE